MVRSSGGLYSGKVFQRFESIQQKRSIWILYSEIPSEYERRFVLIDPVYKFGQSEVFIGIEVIREGVCIVGDDSREI